MRTTTKTLARLTIRVLVTWRHMTPAANRQCWRHGNGYSTCRHGNFTDSWKRNKRLSVTTIIVIPALNTRTTQTPTRTFLAQHSLWIKRTRRRQRWCGCQVMTMTSWTRVLAWSCARINLQTWSTFPVKIVATTEPQYHVSVHLWTPVLQSQPISTAHEKVRVPVRVRSSTVAVRATGATCRKIVALKWRPEYLLTTM